MPAPNSGLVEASQRMVDGVENRVGGTVVDGQSASSMQKQFAQHGRHFSVNLPYASKAGLHTNMSTLQVSKKASQANHASGLQ